MIRNIFSVFVVSLKTCINGRIESVCVRLDMLPLCFITIDSKIKISSTFVENLRVADTFSHHSFKLPDIYKGKSINSHLFCPHNVAWTHLNPFKARCDKRRPTMLKECKEWNSLFPSVFSWTSKAKPQWVESTTVAKHFRGMFLLVFLFIPLNKRCRNTTKRKLIKSIPFILSCCLLFVRRINKLCH